LWPPRASAGGAAASLSDPLLVAVARAADAGAECPALRLLVGNGVLVGQPGPVSGFLEAARVPLIREAMTDRPTEPEGVAARVTEYLHTIHDHVEVADDQEPTALTLYDAQWQSAEGKLGLESIPVIRVPLAAISAWWIAGGLPVARKDEDGFWLVGVSFPLG
jgi:hypothetical protein